MSQKYRVGTLFLKVNQLTVIYCDNNILKFPEGVILTSAYSKRKNDKSRILSNYSE